jgi:4-hydroxy-2-oxoheptanedioate aldolase
MAPSERRSTRRAQHLLGVLGEDRIAFGTALHLSDPDLIEIVALAGYDWVTIPLEHAILSVGEIAALQRAADSRGITTLVHLASAGDERILPLLNSGVGGLVAPQVESPADVEALIRATRFPPLGERGAHSSVRSADYGAWPYPEYVAEVDRSVAIGVVIENAAAVEQLEAIMAVEGLDIAFLGLTDLAQALGVPDQFQHPSVQAAMKRTAAAAQQAGVVLAVSEYGHTPTELRALGARMILAPTSDYAFLLAAFREHLAHARREVEEG